MIVIHEFSYVFLSVSDLSQYVSTWPSKITARLRWEIRPCVLSRSHVSRLFPKKKNWRTRSSAKWGYGTSSMLVVRSVTGYIVAYEIEVSNGNSNTQSTILKNWVRGRFLKFSCNYLNSFSTVSEIISQKVFACLSRQYSLLLNAKAPKTFMASLYPHSVSRHFRRHFLNRGSNIEDCFG